MHPDQYTADAVCRSMGLPGFVEPAWTAPVLRVLLLPSFDPEVCVTLAPDDAGVRVSVVALRDRLWAEPAPRPMPAWVEHASVGADDLDRLLADFAATVAAGPDPAGRVVIIDGMPVECVAVTASGSTRRDRYDHRPVHEPFVADVIRLAWSACVKPGVRNALVACGRYVGVTLPREPDPPPAPEPVRLAILGDPAGRAELAAALHRRAAGQ